jgi:type I restriction enzyme S subunit
MSKIDELIAMLCPDGVERRALKEICEIRSGWGFPNIEQGKLRGDFPFYKVGDMNLAGNETLMTVASNYVDIKTANRLGCKPAPAGTVIFPKIGAAIGTNKKRMLTSLSCYDNNVIGLLPNDDVSSRYLFYQMEAVNLLSFADFSGAMPSIRKATLDKYKIPLPPLPVQQEIVRILDNFTELTAELYNGPIK